MTPIRLERDGDVAVLILDVPGEPVNVLSSSTIAAFEQALDTIAADATLRAAVILSGKSENFIAGADIQEFTRLATAAEAEALAGRGQAVMDRVAAFPKPIVAAIHGGCLGGGTELVLACDWRLATDHPKTQVGLPEIQLGLLPGAGGCNRLPRLIGLPAALDIILAGKSERAAKAKKLGLVDELCAPPILRDVAVRRARALAQDRRRPARKGGLVDSLLNGTGPGRAFVLKKAEETVRAKTGGHYPAPLAALEVIRVSLNDGMTAGLALERRRFGELAMTEVSRNLVQLFFASTALRKDSGLPAGVTASPRPVQRLGVIGSGFMGAGIAGTAASQTDADVRLRDAELSRVGRGLRMARRILDDRLQKRRLAKTEYARRIAALSGGTDLRGFEAADLVIEAVFEDLTVKRQVLAETQAVLPEGAVFATNTSTIPIARIAEGAQRPGSVLGMHFFSPVEKMPLLEVIPHAGTAPEATRTAVQYGRALGKTVIVVADRPGFWVNRILFPYLNEAGYLLEEGVPVETIDRVMTRWGFPVGPVTLIDEVGLDVAAKASAVMHDAFGERMRPGAAVEKLVADGRLGRKNGRGFYAYADGKRTGVDPSLGALIGAMSDGGVAPADVESRLVLAMLNEAAHAFGEGVVRHARDGDLGAIYGIGFPPFRGGPLRALDAMGAATAVATLEGLVARHGPRFAPAPLLVELAQKGGRFHDTRGGAASS